MTGALARPRCQGAWCRLAVARPGRRSAVVLGESGALIRLVAERASVGRRRRVAPSCRRVPCIAAAGVPQRAPWSIACLPSLKRWATTLRTARSVTPGPKSRSCTASSAWFMRGARSSLSSRAVAATKTCAEGSKMTCCSSIPAGSFLRAGHLSPPRARQHWERRCLGADLGCAAPIWIRAPR